MRACVRTHSSTNLRPRQDKDFNFVRTQVKIANDGFDLCPDISQNVKTWIIFVQSWTPQRTKYGYNYGRTQVKTAKDGFEFCPDTSRNRKIWLLCLIDKFVLYGS